MACTTWTPEHWLLFSKNFISWVSQTGGLLEQYLSGRPVVLYAQYEWTLAFVPFQKRLILVRDGLESMPASDESVRQKL